MNTHQITDILSQVGTSRPVFHSEADFQHELALRMSLCGFRVRLEVPFSIQVNGVMVAAQLDMLVFGPEQRRTAIELKYVTAKKAVEHAGETFTLKQNWGTNLSRFDCWADFQRVGGLVAAQHADKGFAIFLTNVADAWNVDVGETVNLGRQFSVHQDRNVTANTMLDWVGNPPTDTVGRKRMPPYSPVTVPQQTSCCWRDFSDLQGSNGRFRFLLLAT